MRIIVSDTSCIIDLRKAALLLEALRLPYTFVTVNTLFEDEWLSLSDNEKKQLCEQGLEIRELPGPSVQRAAHYFNQHRRLKLNDCFALTLAEDTKESILLTGDGQLRRIAQAKGIEVRGVLWITDELETHDIVPVARLLETLRLFQQDPLVFLPKDEILRRIRRLSQIV
jgi:predicted nucleic acid-binding protein